LQQAVEPEFEVPAGLIGPIAVDLLEDPLDIQLIRGSSPMIRLAVPDEALQPLVAWQRALGV
jgi:hypothetical protein